MLYKEITVNAKEGLKSKTAATFVQVAGRFDCQLLIEKGNKKINAKSIMGVLSLNIQQGDTIFLLANGKDEDSAVSALETLLSEHGGL